VVTAPSSSAAGAADATVGSDLTGLRVRAIDGELAADVRDAEDADRSAFRGVCIAGSISATAALAFALALAEPRLEAAAEVDSSIKSRGSRRRNVLGAAAAAANDGALLRDGTALEAGSVAGAEDDEDCGTGLAGDAMRSAAADGARGFDGDAATECDMGAGPARPAFDAAEELTECADAGVSAASNRP
jgi:hypothetical protein